MHPDGNQLALTQRTAKGSLGKNFQPFGDAGAIDLVRFEFAVQQGVTRRRPLIELRTLDLHLPNAELRPTIGLEHRQSDLALSQLSNRFEFGMSFDIFAQLEGQCFGRRRTIAKTDLRFLAPFEIDSPLEPLRLVAGEFHQGERALRGDVPRALDAPLAIHRGEFHHDRIAVAEVLQKVVVMCADDGRGLDADRVTPALRGTAVRQRLKSDVPAAIMPCGEIVVALVRNPAVAIGAKELRQVT